MRGVGLVGALAVTIVLVGACSRYGAEPSAEGLEAGVDGAGAPGPDASAIEDAAPSPDVEPGVRCDRTAPFRSIRPVDGVNTPENESTPRVSPDERVIYFDRSDDTGRIALFRASRRAVTDVFDPPVRVEGIPAEAWQASVTADDLELFFVVWLGVEKRWALWHARRTSLDEPFGNPAPHPADDPSLNILSPFVSSDGAELFYTVYGSNTDLYRVRLAPNGSVVGNREPLDVLNSAAPDTDPVLSPDRLSLYFYSDRSSPNPGMGSIWVAHRDTPDAPFRAPTRIQELAFNDAFTVPGSVSADGCRLYFYTDKDRPTTGLDLFVAERSPQ